LPRLQKMIEYTILVSIMKTKFLCLFFITALIFSACGEGEGPTITSNDRGTYDGYDYEFWSNSNASGKMTLGDAGTFTCEWNNTGPGGNILFRSGKRFGSSQTHSSVGNISISYSAKYSPSGGGASYLSVYGWTQNPLVEYYIVENYLGGYHPGSNGSHRGSFSIDDGTYDIYTRNMYKQPAIQGSGLYDFTQYISVRTSKRSSGTISVSEHFKKWSSLGLDMSGSLYEVMMKVEGYNNNGTAEITKNTLSISK